MCFNVDRGADNIEPEADYEALLFIFPLRTPNKKKSYV